VPVTLAAAVGLAAEAAADTGTGAITGAAGVAQPAAAKASRAARAALVALGGTWLHRSVRALRGTGMAMIIFLGSGLSFQ
jgi:hypothetical protein